MGAEIDQIFVKKAAGYNEISPQEWFEMSLADRMDLLGNGRVKFMRGAESVSVREAVSILNKMKAAS